MLALELRQLHALPNTSLPEMLRLLI